MRLILSRKGMDSSFGGGPSPILPDGSLCPFPIPELGPDAAIKGTPYSRIRKGDTNVGAILSQLTRWRILPDTLAHLDPDLDSGMAERAPGWRPIFGQAAAAESHLVSAGVGPGDVFLFFGWFRRTVEVKGQLRFDRTAPDIHLLYGWLQIDRRISLARRETVPSWALEHPHCKGPTYSSSHDSLYVATEHLDLPGIDPGTIPGGGMGSRYSSNLCLTAPNENRSVWLLPDFFHFPKNAPALTYHSDPARWQPDPDSPGQVRLKSVGRGQEFVLQLPDSPAAQSWVADKVQALAAKPRSP